MVENLAGSATDLLYSVDKFGFDQVNWVVCRVTI